MKHLLILFSLLLLVPQLTVAQTDSLSLEKLYGMVQQLQGQQKRLLNLLELRQQDSLKITALSDDNAALREFILEQQKSYDVQITLLRDSLQSSSSRLDLTAQSIRTYRDKLTAQEDGMTEMKLRIELKDELNYKHIKRNLINAVELYEMLNEKLNALDAFKQLGSYQNLIKNLNNPASKNLGFSYNEKVIELLEKNIAFDKRNKENSKVLKFANVLLQSPLVQGVKNFTPVLSTANSLLSFISGLSVSRRDITEQNLLTFKQELQKYTIYYAKLNEANTTFTLRLGTYEEQNQALHEKLKDLVVQNTVNSNIKLKSPKDYKAETAGDYLNYAFRYYNVRTVERYFENLERLATSKGKVNYGEILKNEKLQNMYKGIESTILLFKDFEQLHNEYITIIDNNNKAVVEILEEAVSMNLSKKNQKIRQEIDLLNKEKKTTVASVNRAINIDRMAEVAKKLSKFPPAI